MSFHNAPAALAACLLALSGVEGLAAQDTASTGTPSPAIETPRPAVEEAAPFGGVRPGVLRVAPEELLRMARDTAEPPPSAADADSVRYITSRLGSLSVRQRSVEGLQVDRQSFVLPYRVLATDGGAGEADGEGSRGRPYLRPVIQVGGEGLSFAGSSEGYRGTVYIGVQDSLQPTSSQELPEPIHFLLDVSGGSVQPPGISVEHTNLPFREVTVVTREVRDSIRLRVRSSVDDEPLPLTLPVSRPSLTVTASPEVIAGLGLETTTLTVSADRLPSGEVPVTFESTMGRPQPSTVQVGPDGSARASLRSSGLGATEVRVRTPGYRPASVRVRFAFPLAFLAAAVLGGVAGGTARHFRERDGGETKRWLRDAGVAVVFGLIVAVGYAVGVNLLGVELGARYGEALIFTLAALGGYFRIPAKSVAPVSG